VVCETNGGVADGKVAWFWRPMVGVKVLMESRGARPGCEARHFRTDGVNTANGPREEREGHRKTTAWGMPGDSGASAVNTGVHSHYSHYAHIRLRVHWAPGIPRALCLMRARVTGKISGASRCGAISHV